MATIKPAIGDIVIYCREDYVGRVDQYEAVITAVYDDNLCDLAVSELHPASPVNIPGVRYDPDGLPSSWHPKGK
jgi:hypothetical protein